MEGTLRFATAAIARRPALSCSLTLPGDHIRSRRQANTCRTVRYGWPTSRRGGLEPACSRQAWQRQAIGPHCHPWTSLDDAVSGSWHPCFHSQGQWHCPVPCRPTVSLRTQRQVQTAGGEMSGRVEQRTARQRLRRRAEWQGPRAAPEARSIRAGRQTPEGCRTWADRREQPLGEPGARRRAEPGARRRAEPGARRRAEPGARSAMAVRPAAAMRARGARSTRATSIPATPIATHAWQRRVQRRVERARRTSNAWAWLPVWKNKPASRARVRAGNPPAFSIVVLRGPTASRDTMP